jgi:transposase
VRGYRINGKVRQEIVANLGRLDILQAEGGLERLIASLARYSERCWVEAEREGLLSWDKVYGPVLIFRRLWEHLGLAQQVAHLQTRSEVEFPLDEAAFAMVLHRLLDPGSKRATYHWLKTVYRPEFELLELHHLYRALDHLVRGKDALEQTLFARNRDLFSLTVDLVLFDTTLIHFEGRGPEELAAFARPGNYPDCVKVLIGLVMTGDGFPVAHHVFPGNTADINAFRQALGDLRRRFLLRKVVIVADRGVVSEEVVEELEKEEVNYILGMPLRKNKEVSREVLSRPGRYHQVSDHLEVKEVWVGGHRYVVCYNAEEEIRDRERREQIMKHTRKELEEKGPQAFIMPRGLRRFVELKGGELILKESALRQEARYDGKWILRTNTDLPAGEVAQDYQSLWQVEHVFRELKSGLEIRPVFVRTEEHVRGHIAVCFLALVLETALQKLLKQQGATRFQEVMADLEQLRAVRLEARGKAWLWRNELTGRAYDAFQAVGVRPPARIQPLT